MLDTDRTRVLDEPGHPGRLDYLPWWLVLR